VAIRASARRRQVHHPVDARWFGPLPGRVAHRSAALALAIAAEVAGLCA
jgi:hypothetical protein